MEDMFGVSFVDEAAAGDFFFPGVSSLRVLCLTLEPDLSVAWTGLDAGAAAALFFPRVFVEEVTGAITDMAEATLLRVILVAADTATAAMARVYLEREKGTDEGKKEKDRMQN